MKTDQRPPVSPALLRHLRERSRRREDRVADQITRFAGSMKFVYLHALWFSLWILLGSRTTRSACSRWSCRWRPSSCRPS